MIRLAFGTLACAVVLMAAVAAAGTVWAVPFGLAAVVAGGLIVLIVDRGPIR